MKLYRYTIHTSAFFGKGDICFELVKGRIYNITQGKIVRYPSNLELDEFEFSYYQR